MDRLEFQKLFSELTDMKENPYHPLVWMNGDPEIGDNVYIGGMTEVYAKGAKVVIGDNCDIASFVVINCSDSHKKTIGISDSVERKDIIIENNVYIGTQSFIGGGVHIGHHSVVGAGTIVRAGEYPPYSLIVGNPATVKPGYYRMNTKNAVKNNIQQGGTNMLKNRTVIVFGIEHYNPLGVIRSLGESGISPVFISISGRADVASASKYVEKVHRVKDYVEGCQLLLKEYGNYPPDDIPVVITSDDEQVGFMDEHYDEYKGKFIFFNAGKAGGITRYMDKFNILELAKKYGLNTLTAKSVKRGVIPEGISYPVITKSIAPNVGGWKSDVFICESEEELKAAYEKIKSPRVLVQHYIDKKNELVLEGFSACRGTQVFISIASLYKYNIKGYYSPYHDVDNFRNEKLNTALTGMLKEIGFEGIYEIEFLIDQDDNLFFSEINFRNSTWSYASTCAGMNLPVLWAETMLTGKIPENAYKEIEKPFTAMVEPIDYQKRVIERDYSLDKWFADLKAARCKYYYNEQDPKPFFVMLENNHLLR